MRSERAVPFAIGLDIEPNVPRPALLVNEHSALLVVTTKSETLVAIEFTECVATRFSGLNDEAQSAHPLFGRGLEFYQTHYVENSTWLEEVRGIHKTMLATTRSAGKT